MANVLIKNSPKLIPPVSIIRFQGGLTSITKTGCDYTAILTGDSSNDPDGSIAIYIWERKLSTGNWVQIGSTNVPIFTDTVSVAGTYKYRLKVTDNDNLSSYSSEITLIFSKGSLINPVAMINGGTSTYIETTETGLQVLLNSNGSTAGCPGDSIVSREWTVVIPVHNKFTLQGANSTVAKFSAREAGSFVIELKITNSNNLVDTINANITVI